MTSASPLDAAPHAGPARFGRARPSLVPAAILGVAALCAVALALPGRTVTVKYLPELFVLLDGAWRVASGQVPNRDFHTVFGPLVHLLPAAGLRLAGPGGALPIAGALFLMLLALPMAHSLASRLRGGIALPLAAVLILIAAVPVTLGESVTSLSFAHLYNRVGWAALASLLVLYLPALRPRPRQHLVDALAAAALVMLMLYTKATYAAAALAFVGAALLDRDRRRWAAPALALVAAAALVVEAVWGASRAYLDDLLLAYSVSGGVRGSGGQILDHVLRNLADFVLFTLFVGLALWRRRSLRDLLFYAFCAGAGFLLINQNFQAWGIITLYAGAAVAAETLARSEETDDRDWRWPLGRGAPLLMTALVVPTILHCTLALGLHTALATGRAGEALGLGRLTDIRLANLWTWGEHEAATHYLTRLAEGANLLGEVEPRPGTVAVLDVANPLPVALGLPPAPGGSPWLLWGRTLDAVHFLPPERLLGGAQFVLEPKGLSPAPPEVPFSDQGVGGLRQVYGRSLEAAFEVVREGEHWRMHRRRAPSGVP